MTGDNNTTFCMVSTRAGFGCDAIIDAVRDTVAVVTAVAVADAVIHVRHKDLQRAYAPISGACAGNYR